MIVGTAFSFNNDSGGNHLFATEISTGPGQNLPATNISGTVNALWDATSLPHQMGNREADGWSVAASNGQGYFAYGPYDRSMPDSPMVATFTYMADNNSDLDIPVVAFEVYDSSTGQILARQQISRRGLPTPFNYGSVSVAFDWRGHAGHAIETRAWSYGVSYLKLHSVRLQESF